jgi:hypothetical protein
MNSELKDIVSKLLNRPIGELKKLHGDASYRTYYRAAAEDGETFIVMQMPEGKQSVSEEITNFNGTHEELPFIGMTRYLHRCGLPVPNLIARDEADHLLVIRDLGDTLLFGLVDGKPSGVQREWYAKAVDLLLKIQKATGDNPSEKCIAFNRSFDETLFNWEFDHFREYGIEARTGKSFEKEDRAVFDECSRSISKEITSFPYGFTHRDFQSRNLLLKDGELFMIDYQDALMGPVVYDLVALLRDSYVTLPSDLVRELIDYYARERNLDAGEVRYQFDLVTIQRKLKDAGRFVFIDRVKGNPKFLNNIPTSLGYVREAFERSGAHRKLYGMLRKYIPEWQ